MPAQPLEGRGTFTGGATNPLDRQRGHVGIHTCGSAPWIAGQQVCARRSIQARGAFIGVENLAGAGVVDSDTVAHGVKESLVVALGAHAARAQPGTDDHEEREDHVLLEIHAADATRVEEGVVDESDDCEAHHPQQAPAPAPIPAPQQALTTQGTESDGQKVGRVDQVRDGRDLAGERGKLLPPRGLVMNQPDDLRVQEPVIRNQVGNAEGYVGGGQSDQEALGPKVRIQADEPGQHSQDRARESRLPPARVYARSHIDRAVPRQAGQGVAGAEQTQDTEQGLERILALASQREYVGQPAEAEDPRNRDEQDG